MAKSAVKAKQPDAAKGSARGFREMSWQEFDRLSRTLAEDARAFQAEMVIGIAKGGIFLGGALAGLLGLDFQPVRLVERSRDRRGPGQVALRQDMPPEVEGRRILLVDDVCQSGNTLKLAKKQAKAAGAKAVRTATMLLRLTPEGKRYSAKVPDYFALETGDLVVFPWDYELAYGGGAVEEGDPETFGA
jgi:hypoxanthine phosphoribosyltransferase